MSRVRCSFVASGILAFASAIRPMGCVAMSKKRLLPLIGEREMVLFTSGGAELYKFLCLPGDPASQVFHPLERVLRQDGPVTVADCSQHRRYLYLADHEQAPIAVLVVSKVAVGRHTSYLSFVFVNPSYRRRGIASHMLASALADFPQLALDNRLTVDGLAFFRCARENKSELAHA